MTTQIDSTSAVRRAIRAYSDFSDSLNALGPPEKLTEDEREALWELDQAIIELERFHCSQTGERRCLSDD